MKYEVGFFSLPKAAIQVLLPEGAGNVVCACYDSLQAAVQLLPLLSLLPDGSSVPELPFFLGFLGGGGANLLYLNIF